VTILARGGSKGLPGKKRGCCRVNRSLRVHRAGAGLGAGSDCGVSDDEKILEIGYEHGVYHIKRPEALALDETPKVDAIKARAQMGRG